MKFGERLKSEIHAPFAEGYIRYDELKSNISTMETGFGSTLNEEVKRISEFEEKLKTEATIKLESLESRWKDVLNWKKSSFPDVDEHINKSYEDFKDFAMHLSHILDFVSLNIVGIQKICKKHDRRTGEVSGPLILNKLQRDSDNAYLAKLSDTKELEILVMRTRKCLDEIQQIQVETDKNLHKVMSHPKGPDYLSIPRYQQQPPKSPLPSTSTLSSNDGISTAEDGSLLLEILAKPLLCGDIPTTTIGENVWIAILGAFLSGIGIGGFWTICEMSLTSWGATFAVLFLSSGSLTGTRPALTGLYYITFALSGAIGSFLTATISPENYERHPFISLGSCWLLGVCFGCWTVQLPRQLVCMDTPLRYRVGVSMAPFFGYLVGSSSLVVFKLHVGTCATIYSLCWFAFFLLVFGISRSALTNMTPKLSNGGSESEVDSLEEQPTKEVETHSKWKDASSSALAMGVLSSLAIDRTVRTLVALEVVSFFPTINGEDFFLLSIASFVAALVGTLVPAWACTLVGCFSMYLLNGPGLIVWIWVEASCRNDLSKCDPQQASKADTILCGADGMACILFAIELTYLESENDTPYALTYLSGLLLLGSSFGRMIFARL